MTLTYAQVTCNTAKAVIKLDLKDNLLAGDVPESVTELGALELLDVSENAELGGDLGALLAGFTDIRAFKAKSCRFAEACARPLRTWHG